MPNGNLFRREQRQRQRTQVRWTNLQNRTRNRQTARARDEERIRRAQEEARRRAEEEERRREAEERRLAEEARRRLEERRRRREEARRQRDLLEQQRQQLQLAKQARLLQEQQRQLLLDQALAAIATDYGACRAGLNPLRLRCVALQARLTRLIGFLTGTNVGELQTSLNDQATLTAIVQRCTANALQVEALFGGLKTCSYQQMDQETLRVAPLLNALAVALQGDTLTEAAIAITTAASEATHNANLAHMATYPNLGLTLAVIQDGEGPIANLSNAQLLKLNTKLAGHRVTAWTRARMPGTRPNFSGQYLLIPLTLSYFPYSPSGEVFHDWIWDRVGHGQTAASMRQMLDPHSHTRTIITVNEQQQQPSGRWVLTSPNAQLQIVLDPGKTLLITYYYRP